MPKPPPTPPKRVQASSWSEHKENWKACTLCGLCKKRSHVVLGRGKLPADILFVGEAPGDSENTLGRPFVGPAGMLLDAMIQDALTWTGLDTDPPRMAFTNLVACIPKRDKPGTAAPKKDEVKACAPRLQEFVDLVKPKAVVTLGQLSAKLMPEFIDLDVEFSAELTHPAAILRADPTRKELSIQRATIQLQDLLEAMYHA